MKRFGILLKNEMKLSVRDMNMVIFAVLMPQAMQRVVALFPLTQGITLMKNTFLGISQGNWLLPVGVMAGVTAICTALAIRFFRWE